MPSLLILVTELHYCILFDALRSNYTIYSKFTVLPVATHSGRRPAPQAPQKRDYQNVEESDLPTQKRDYQNVEESDLLPFVQKHQSGEGKRLPVTYHRSEAWKEV